jgi:hypothetical protein
MKHFEQYAIKYKDLQGNEKMIDTFWVDQFGNIDQDNLPGDREVSELLKVLLNKEVYAEATGKTVSDDE